VRAVEPVETARLRLRGFELAYELFGDPAAPALLLLPTWQITPSRHWRMQVAYLSRFRRVIAFDPPGIGRAERTTDPAAFELDRVVDYGIGLLDHLGVRRAAVAGVSMGGSYGLWLAARYPERVEKLVLMGSVPPEWAFGKDPTFWERRDSYVEWEKRNAHYWREHYREWLDFFFGKVVTEPHSTKLIDDFVDWALETTPKVLIASVINPALFPELALKEAVVRVSCPVLVMHGRADAIADIQTSLKLAEARPDWELVTFEGSGHVFHARDPVRTNLTLAEFLDVPPASRRSFRRAMTRDRRRALFISSAIGLGHVQRDLAIARELRHLVPELEIDWLAQHPVSRVLEQAGERIHPLSALLALESAHWERSARGYDLHCFYAWREMDEILLANFMLFLEAVRDTPYDVWIGDEAWEVDYYLHENPELKTAPFVFLTDFLGWLPVEGSPGSREAALTADYNAEMIEQVARYPRVRDRALYVGDYDDIVPERFGPGLPLISDWARENFTAVGYILPFDPEDYMDQRAVRARLGHDAERPLIVCTVGGTSVGRPLLDKAIEAWPLIQRERPEAKCVVICGPRIDPAGLPTHPGLEVRAYVHNLFEHLAAADLGVVQGGLSTTMELVATRRPFIYFPLANHCEQEIHVAHRLDRYRAGRRAEFAATTAESLADATLASMASDTSSYRRCEPGGAEQAAKEIAKLL